LTLDVRDTAPLMDSQEPADVHVLYSARQLGNDLLPAWIVHFLREHWRTGARAFDVDGLRDSRYNSDFSESAKALVLLDAVEFYTKNRLRLNGRAWTCACAWCYDSIHPFKTAALPPSEVGVHAVFSNCASFVKELPAMIPAAFCWKPQRPTPPKKPFPRSGRIGAVLPNVADRDFCLLERARSIAESVGKPASFTVYLPAFATISDLPVSLAKHAVVGDSESFGLDRLDAVIPAPRLTDYRHGIVPPELLQALLYGKPVLAIYHPALDAVVPHAHFLLRSLSAFDEAVAAALELKDLPRLDPDDENVRKDLNTTPERFVDLVMTAAQNWLRRKP